MVGGGYGMYSVDVTFRVRHAIHRGEDICRRCRGVLQGTVFS